MSLAEKVYLGGVLIAFASFALTLALGQWLCRAPRDLTTASAGQPAAEPAKAA